MIDEAKAQGLDAITLTEHFNTHRFEDVYGTLDTLYPCNNHYYDVDGFRIFTGMEVDVAEGGHILVSGPKDKLLEVRAALDGSYDAGPFHRTRRSCSSCASRGA